MRSSSLLMHAALALVRMWTRLYTTGLPAEMRERRFAEIESDIREHCDDSAASAVDAFLYQVLIPLL